jgi:hypothetical protein
LSLDMESALRMVDVLSCIGDVPSSSGGGGRGVTTPAAGASSETYVV